MMRGRCPPSYHPTLAPQHEELCKTSAGQPGCDPAWARVQGMRHDSARLAELRRALILDSGPEQAFDDITRLLATTLAVPFTMVNLLDAERDWFKSCVGVQQTESPAVTSLCEVFFTTTEDLVVVEDTLRDARTDTHPKVAGRPYIRFYAAARLKVRGETIGTLCAYDTQARRLSADQLDNLRTLAAAAVELITRRSARGEQPPTQA
jgi:GAF domain-containing protein